MAKYVTPDDKDPDDKLDEIDEVFEENAEEFVKNYVQKPGFGDKGDSCVESHLLSSSSLGPVQDRHLRVLIKLTTAANCLNDREGNVQFRMQRALDELIPVQPADLPEDLRDNLQVIRYTMEENTNTVTDQLAAVVIRVIVFLRKEMERRLQPE